MGELHAVERLAGEGERERLIRRVQRSRGVDQDPALAVLAVGEADGRRGRLGGGEVVAPTTRVVGQLDHRDARRRRQGAGGRLGEPVEGSRHDPGRRGQTRAGRRGGVGERHGCAGHDLGQRRLLLGAQVLQPGQHGAQRRPAVDERRRRRGHPGDRPVPGGDQAEGGVEVDRAVRAEGGIEHAELAGIDRQRRRGRRRHGRRRDRRRNRVGGVRGGRVRDLR